MRKRTLIMISSLVVLIVVIVSILVFSRQSQGNTTVSTPPERSTQELLNVIVRDNSNLKDSHGQPVIDIVSSERVSTNWYAIKIKLKNDTSDNYARVLLKDPVVDVGQVTVVAGPGTTFSASNLRSLGVPDEVITKIGAV